MRFSTEFIERVQDSNNLLDIISQYTQLKPVGGGFMGRCPFPDHPEKTPSFSVSEAKQVFHCFGCQKRGNIFSFLQLYNGMSFVEAVEYLAERANIALPQEAEDPQKDLAAKRKRDIYGVNLLAANFFVEQLKRSPKDSPQAAYIEKRGINQETIDTLQIGYASAEWDSLVSHLQSKSISLPLAEEARLIKARKEGRTGYFDLFRDRLIFPIFKPSGEVLGFGGRIIAQGEPKYLNSPESSVFSKGKILYGLHETAKYIRSEDRVIVVEGYMDFVSLFQSGIRNVVATMGTALTADHGKLLRRLTRNVVVLFDGDEAGQSAAERSLPVLLGADLHPKGITLPGGLDPDDFLKQEGKEALLELISDAKDLYSQQLGLWLQGYKGEASQKLQIADRLRPVLGAIQDPRMFDLCVGEAGDRMGVGTDWLKKAVLSGTNPGPVGTNNAQRPTNAVPKLRSSTAPMPLGAALALSLQGVSRAEATLLSLVLKARSHLEAFRDSDVGQFIGHEGVRKILQKALETYGQSPEKFDKLAGLFTSQVDKPELLFLAWEQTPNTASSPDPVDSEETKLLLDCFKKVKDSFLKQKADQLAIELKAQSSPEKLEQFMNIQKMRVRLNKE